MEGQSHKEEEEWASQSQSFSSNPKGKCLGCRAHQQKNCSHKEPTCNLSGKKYRINVEPSLRLLTIVMLGKPAGCPSCPAVLKSYPLNFENGGHLVSGTTALLQ